MNVMNTRPGSQAASRGIISIFSKYSGTAKSSVIKKAKAKAHGARTKWRQTANTSNIVRNRFLAANCTCKNGRCSRTSTSNGVASRMPTAGLSLPTASSEIGTTSQAMPPMKPRNPSQK